MTVDIQQRVKTGIPGLDEILEGGFLPQSSVLIEGPPGSGKTNLGIQILYNGIHLYGVPGILFSFEQSPEAIIRDAARFGWDLQSAVDHNMLRIITTTPLKMQETFAGVGTEVDAEIEAACLEINPRRSLIDSISHFRRITSNEAQLREIMHNFLHCLGGHGITTFLTKEVRSDDDNIGFEEYAVDASLRLHDTPLGGMRGNMRTMEVRKTRGHGHLAGRHPFVFGKTGLEVYPHRPPAAPRRPEEALAERPRVSTGVPSLDRLLHGGLPKNSSTLLAGTTGAGKTALALQFILEGLRNNESGLMVNLNESPQRIAERMTATGFDTAAALREHRLHLHYDSPVNLCVEKLAWDIEQMVKENDIHRVVIDSLSDFQTSLRDANQLRDATYTILRLLDRLDTTVLLTTEVEAFAGGMNVSDIALAYVVDGVIFMGFAEIESRMRRVISILKMRGTAHESELRELALTDKGPVVGAKFSGLSGVLGGTPTGRYQETIEEIMQPLYFLRSFSDMLTGAELPEDKRRTIAANLKEQADKVVAFICEFHGIDPDQIGKQLK